MDRIVRSAEAVVRTPTLGASPERERSFAEVAAVTHAARVLAERIQAIAILAATHSGRTAHLLSMERTDIPIFAFSPVADVCRRLALWWGIVPVQQALERSDIGTAEGITKHLHHIGVGREDDWVVVVEVHHGNGDKPIGVVAHHLLGVPK